ncbi:hypothetical protein [Prauserella muralis]|uniref:Uncharacterized protein n=1 Tax=Prauserella muralis TaxID=588067 RepID=A0A2V4BP56_9PSEU|nr:hypothetical protein [Prauserella muralis]PXY32393.1 hypothetical protein BAY60_09005 [Prauserella muralis]TWE23919.1 hypothetical protein FHX69_5221 [Prauserella muralis]
MREPENNDGGLRWGLIVALGAVALVRPVLSIVGALDALGKPWSPIAVTALIAIVWTGAAVATRAERPVPTLALAGVAYAVLAIVLNLVTATVTDEGRFVTVPGAIAMLATNALYGAVLGVVAHGLLRLRERARR